MKPLKIIKQALFQTVLIFALFHLAIIAFHAVSTGDFAVLDPINVLDLSYIDPSLASSAGRITAVFAMATCLVVAVVFGSRKSD